MEYELWHDQQWGEALVKLRVFNSRTFDDPKRELTLTIESGDGNAGTTTVLSETAASGLHLFRELMLELQSAIEYAETGDVTNGNQ